MQVNKALGTHAAASANTGLLYISDDEDEDDDVRLNKDSYATAEDATNLGNIKDSNKPEDDMEEGKQNLAEHLMEENEVFVHGGPKFHTEYVKIIDKSRRAFSISLDSTKAFEMSLKKPRNSCGDRCTRFRAVLYALWLLTFRHHGKAPGRTGLFAIFFGFSLCIALDLVLVTAMMSHILGPMSNLTSIGIPFLCVYPGIAVLAPIYGAIGCMIGSPRMLRSMSTMNATCVLVNYPATIFTMWYLNDEPVYICVVAVLWLFKIPVSFFGSKVRQHLINPAFIPNEAKFAEMAERVNEFGTRFPKDRSGLDLDASPDRVGQVQSIESEENPNLLTGGNNHFDLDKSGGAQEEAE